jgi:uncharacterized protein (TIGR03382 family)
MVSRAAVATGLVWVALGLPGPAEAADFSRQVRPGVTSFKRITAGARPQKIHAVRVDLAAPGVGLYASADLPGEEWRTDTLDFAERTPGAIAAINGDWSCNSSGCTGDRWLRPLGLAVSGGVMWRPHRTIPADPDERWGYLSCTVDKRCTIRTRVLPLNNPATAEDPVRTPTRAPLRAQNAIGGNGLRMITGGVPGSGCYDATSAPRSAVCLERDGTHLWLVVVDGRDAANGETGMTCDEVRDLLAAPPFNCWDALMLDGGGSSTLVVEDDNASATCHPRGRRDLCVKNSPSDGALRTVGNHLAITWRDAPDARCALPNGRWCDGARVTACEGGRFRGVIDCAADGATCQADGAHAFCVDARCPGGDGLGRTGCADATRVAACSDGVLATVDCAADGRVCGGEVGAAGCMDPRCPSPDGATCAGATWLGCTAGVLATADCAAEGRVCHPVDGCVAPAPQVDAGADDDAGDADDAGAGDAAADGDAGADPRDLDAGGPARDAGEATDAGPPTALRGTGCATVGGEGTAALGLLLLGLRRRRAPRRQ